MSKKDFVALAAALRSALDKMKTPATRCALAVAVEQVADVCAASNGLFD